MTMAIVIFIININAENRSNNESRISFYLMLYEMRRSKVVEINGRKIEEGRRWERKVR
jgi:hypothetical protein